MKYFFLLLIIVLGGCESKLKKNDSKSYNKQKIETPKISIEHNKYDIGDIDNDKIKDTAYVNLKRNIENDELECGGKNCYITIEFKNKIPEISFDQSRGVYITKAPDLNKDNANEIIIFSRTQEGWWNDVSIFTFKNKKWSEMAKTKAFIGNDNDFKNRIVKENDRFYLIGDNQWEEDDEGNFKKIKVLINN